MTNINLPPHRASEILVEASNALSTTVRRNAAIAALYERYGNLVRQRCRRFLRDEAATEDAVQTTFMNLIRHYDRHEAPPEPGDAIRLIYAITTNCCINMWRKRRNTPEMTALDELPDIEGDSLESRVVAADLLRRLHDELPAPLLETAWMWYADGMTQDEIAEVLGIGRRAVAARMARFRKLLSARWNKPDPP